MRWKQRPPVRIGDTRVRRGFLWLPKKAKIRSTGDPEWRWLEIALWQEEMVRIGYAGRGWSPTWWDP